MVCLILQATVLHNEALSFSILLSKHSAQLTDLLNFLRVFDDQVGELRLNSDEARLQVNNFLPQILILLLELSHLNEDLGNRGVIARPSLLLKEDGQFFQLGFVIITLRLDHSRHPCKLFKVQFRVLRNLKFANRADHSVQSAIVLLKALASDFKLLTLHH